MHWPALVNDALERTTGRRLVRVGPNPEEPSAAPAPPRPPPPDRVAKELVRPAAHPVVDRLVPRPVFVMSSVRSGSTLLRSLLDAHPDLHAPHELHVRRLRVHATTDLAAKAMELLGHNEADLEHLLWDRVMHRELTLSRKQQFVDKTPANVFAWRRIATCWPEARYVFLLRHPASVAASWARATGHKWTLEEATLDSLRYLRALDRAWRHLDGLTVRYEDLTDDPAAVTQRICAFLEVEWEEEMLDYGERTGSATYLKGTGDWGPAIRSGRVLPARELPADEDVPEVLRPISRRWGYLSSSDAS
jgi:hypothetical protein